MSKEKQIEEMADDVRRIRESYFGQADYLFAMKLYEDGYRKQSEGEWVDQYNGKYDNPIYVCSVCRRGTLLKPDINELGNIQMIQALSQFCPNCGAKMKGGAE